MYKIVRFHFELNSKKTYYYLRMTFPSEIQLLSNELRHAYLRLLMICKCITCVTPERTREVDANRTDRDSFYSPRNALEILPGACPVTDRRFSVCFIGLNTHFRFEKKMFIS